MMLSTHFDNYDLSSMEKFGSEQISATSVATCDDVSATKSSVVGLQSIFKMHRSEVSSVSFL